MADGDDDIADEVEAFNTFMDSPISAKQQESIYTAFTDRLIGIGTDVSRLQVALRTADDLAIAISARGIGTIIDHATTPREVSFKHQYVDRDLKIVESGQTRPSDTLVTTGRPFRAVLIGPPGAGKSTFVKYLVDALADPSLRDTPIPSVIVPCREYNRLGWSTQLAEFASKQISISTAVDVDQRTFEDILLFGKVAVIFDGLDEITDLSRRSEMVRRITVFRNAYPTASVLVTSREVGYSHAPLDRQLFPEVKLEEFNEGQIEEYASKWFSGYGRSELVDSFMRESQTLADLRRNPLLLSLVCLLYKESGNIPASRRGIYRQCADLLFHRWDAHRQIAQHESMPEFGDRIMQEIATWFYKFPTTQTGVEERQIVRVVAAYMRDNIGFLENRAESVATDFVKFCADRAWLLSVIGVSERGERLFSFVHRTFFEFFTAESFARQAADSAAAAKFLIEAYNRDQTSVVPELLVQSFDFYKDRGATNLYIELCARAPVPLLMRLLQGIAIAPHALTAGFDRFCREVESRRNGVPYFPEDNFDSLIQLGPIAREFFVDRYLFSDDGNRVRETFLASWAAVILSGSPAIGMSSWDEVVGRMLVEYRHEVEGSPAEVVSNWRALMGLEASDRSSLDPLHFVGIFGPYGQAIGTVGWAILSVFGDGQMISLNSSLIDAIDSVHCRVESDALLPVSRMGLISSGLGNYIGEGWSVPVQMDPVVIKLYEILGLLALALHDFRGSSEYRSISHLWPGKGLIGVVDAREAVGRPVHGRRMSEISDVFRVLPTRCQDWAAGKCALTQSP
ncbi:GTPase SAR1 family protein [Arthrobacter woluwensis]|uniref:NACHT domain-containing protein n=1 Tax=Arthrobacter woluwensis TaxID=156980 RepID=UPI00278ACCD7|nr:NACHT domain-containing protein [Arthrobacter woluwensis]MDQ0708395.1 GTPase SAR1 family protein [Arthrobacter woluwensis]